MRSFLRLVAGVLYGVTLLGAALGFYDSVILTTSVDSAPQQAALAAMAIAGTAIPYCAARAVEGWLRLAQQDELVDLARHQARHLESLTKKEKSTHA